jgi:hypothetical protein
LGWESHYRGEVAGLSDPIAGSGFAAGDRAAVRGSSPRGGSPKCLNEGTSQGPVVLRFDICDRLGL